MILILSTSNGEATTDQICNWLEKLNMKFFRLNLDQAFDLISDFSLCNIKDKVSTLVGTSDLVVWFRRGYSCSVSNLLYSSIDNLTAHKSVTQIMDEVITWQSWFVKTLQQIWPSVNDYENVVVNKLEVLTLAANYGFYVPRTFVTHNLNIVENWLKNKSRLICKPLSEISTFHVHGKIYRQITREVKLECIQQLKKRNQQILFSLFQEYINKKGDVRVFYIGGKCHAVLILSNEDDKAKIDGRNFNIVNPVRMTPIGLPKELEKNIQKLTTSLKLETCSIDFVLSEENKFYFLEVNPVGQFGWISNICGCNLHRELALYLIKKYEKEYSC